VSVPRLMVESTLSGAETPAERKRQVAELFDVRRLLATVANNVNQLARGVTPFASRGNTSSRPLC
jgi:hypothetical protein